MSMANKIEKAEIIRARQAWAQGIVELGQVSPGSKDFTEMAEKFVSGLYGYAEGTVLFKPTKAREKQFRLTSEGAVSYFIGGNSAFPEDHGFALRPWRNVRFENAGFLFYENAAVVIGNYYFLDYKGIEINAEYTFGYFRVPDGSLKINLHHSSLPFHPEDPRCRY